MDSMGNGGLFPATQADVGRLGNDIAAIKSDVTDVKGDITALKNDVAGVKGDISFLKNDVAGVKGDISFLKNDVAGVKSDITALQNDVTDVKGDIAVLKNDVAGVKGDITGIKGDMTEIKGELGRLDLKIDTSFRRLAIEIVDVRTELRDFKSVVATKADIQRFVDAVENFAGKAQSYDAAKVLHGQALTDVQVQMRDHERRIKSLENRPQ